MQKIEERFFIEAPTPTNEHQIYIDAGGNPLRWSGDFPIPAIGDPILVRMNSIGPAVVKGYFESCGFIGVMALPVRPPDWYVRQSQRAKLTWQKQNIGCFFGKEIAPERRST